MTFKGPYANEIMPAPPQTEPPSKSPAPISNFFLHSLK